MRIPGARHTARALCAAGAALAVLAAGCSGADTTPSPQRSEARESASARSAAPHRVPGVSERLHSRIPDDSRQVVAVYGKGADSAVATVVLYARRGSGPDSTWTRTRSWPAHNGKRGWTPDHREGDKRSPVGVFTLSDAGGVLPDPSAGLPYTRSAAFTAPRYWPKSHWHDFDYVIAIDYNRVKGTSPADPARPEGQTKGGGIWLHMDHGSGTSGCVSLSKSGMEYLLRTLDPEQHPVVVMGDSARLAG